MTMTDVEKMELKPCPFCGERLERSETFSTRTRDYFVHPTPDMLSYDMCPLTEFRLVSNDPDGIAAWNRRTPDPSALIERVKVLEEEKAELRRALSDLMDAIPGLPEVHRWTGQEAAEDLFDLGLRHKSGKRPYDYLVAWLGMLRPFAYATRDDSWGEMEKLLCIVMRNYVRVSAAAIRARSALSNATGGEGYGLPSQPRSDGTVARLNIDAEPSGAGGAFSGQSAGLLGRNASQSNGMGKAPFSAVHNCSAADGYAHCRHREIGSLDACHEPGGCLNPAPQTPASVEFAGNGTANRTGADDTPGIPPSLCEDCPPTGYPTDVTRCAPCPRRSPTPSVDPGA